MRSNPNERERTSSFALDELEALYDAQALGQLIARALDQLRTDGETLESHLAAGALSDAAQVLHRMKGTVAFFAQHDRPLAALHEAESALRLGETAALAETLSAARLVFAALERTLGAALIGRRPGGKPTGPAAHS